MRAFIAFCLFLLLSIPLAAQKQKHDPLTPDQQDQIAEAGIDPVARVDLYVKFIDEHAETIRGLIKRAKTPARAQRLNYELEDFTTLLDEFGDNLDVFSEREADVRKSLKILNGGVARWQSVLHDLPSEPGFDLALKDAQASMNELAAQAKQLTSNQEAYFKEHPDEKNQDRAEPK